MFGIYTRSDVLLPRSLLFQLIIEIRFLLLSLLYTEIRCAYCFLFVLNTPKYRRVVVHIIYFNLINLLIQYFYYYYFPQQPNMSYFLKPPCRSQNTFYLNKKPEEQEGDDTNYQDGQGFSLGSIWSGVKSGFKTITSNDTVKKLGSMGVGLLVGKLTGNNPMAATEQVMAGEGAGLLVEREGDFKVLSSEQTGCGGNRLLLNRHVDFAVKKDSKSKTNAAMEGKGFNLFNINGLVPSSRTDSKKAKVFFGFKDNLGLEWLLSIGTPSQYKQPDIDFPVVVLNQNLCKMSFQIQEIEFEKQLDILHNLMNNQKIICENQGTLDSWYREIGYEVNMFRLEYQGQTIEFLKKPDSNECYGTYIKSSSSSRQNDYNHIGSLFLLGPKNELMVIGAICEGCHVDVLNHICNCRNGSKKLNWELHLLNPTGVFYERMGTNAYSCPNEYSIGAYACQFEVSSEKKASIECKINLDGKRDLIIRGKKTFMILDQTTISQRICNQSHLKMSQIQNAYKQFWIKELQGYLESWAGQVGFQNGDKKFQKFSSSLQELKKNMQSACQNEKEGGCVLKLLEDVFDLYFNYELRLLNDFCNYQDVQQISEQVYSRLLQQIQLQ